MKSRVARLPRMSSKAAGVVAWLSRRPAWARRSGPMVAVGLAYVVVVAGIMIWRGISVSPDYLLLVFIPVALLSGRFFRFLGDWVPFIAIFLGWEAMRGIVHNDGIAPQVASLANLEKWLFFGHDPSQVLQHAVSGTTLHVLAVAATIVYFCHFVVPLLVGLVLWLKRRDEKHGESATGIIPGDRGKEGGSWCHPPLRRGQPRAAGTITSSSGRCHDRSSDMTQELSGETQNRNRVRAESGPRDVSARVPAQLPRGLRLLLQETRTQLRCPAGSPPAKRPGPYHGWGAQGKRGGGERAGQAKPVKPPHLGGVKNHVTQLQGECSLRVKRPDP